MYIHEDTVVTTTSSCAITGFTAYHSTSDTGASPSVLVSPYSTAAATESFWYYHHNDRWYFDG